MTTFLFLALTQLQSTAQKSPQIALEVLPVAEIQKLVDQFRAKEGAVGISVSVRTAKSHVTFTSGYANRETKAPVQKSSLFRLGSISKSITVTVLMRLVAEKRVNLDQGVSTYLPNYPDENGQITLRRVLSHTAGIRHYNNSDKLYYEPVSTAQALDIIRNSPLVAPPGTEYSYSTHSYAIPVAIAENVLRRPFRDILRRTLGGTAKALDIEWLARDRPERCEVYVKATPEAKQDGKREDITWKTGGGGMESTPSDLTELGIALLRGQVIATSARDEMWQAQKLANGDALDYGLGWSVSSTTASHGGSQQGCSTFLHINRTQSVVIAAMTNTRNIPISNLVTQIRQTLAKK